MAEQPAVRRFMIGNGEVLRSLAPEVSNSFRPKSPLRSLATSKAFIQGELTQLFADYHEADPKMLLDDVYVGVDYPKYYVAKSSQIESLYRRSKLTVVGTDNWIDSNDELGRRDIVRGSIKAFEQFEHLSQAPDTKKIENELDRVHGIDLLTPQKQIDALIDLLDDPLSDLDDEQMVELCFYQVSDPDVLLARLRQVLALPQPLNDLQSVQVGNTLYVTVRVNRGQSASGEGDDVLKPAALMQVAQFNPLRSAVVSSGRDMELLGNDVNHTTYHEPTAVLPIVGMVDGGVDVHHQRFEMSQAKEHYTVASLPSAEALEHGTSVASILMYGELLTNHQDVTPELRVESIRALPSKEENFNLIELDQILQEAIPELSNIKIWNISIGPIGPVLDEHVASLTAILDHLAYEYDVLFVIAIGNTGRQMGIAKRMQTPGDAVNNLTVAASTTLNGNQITASYSSIGPGREGGKVKPDVIAHGGSATDDAILTFSANEFLLNRQFGTSFAAPLVARLLAKAMFLFPNLSVLELRAAVTQYLALNYDKGRDIYSDAKGELDEDPAQLLEAAANEFRIKYSGTLTTGSKVLLNIPIPDEFQDRTLEFVWTIAIKTDVDETRPDAYTKFGIIDTFYPDVNKYNYRRDSKVKRVDQTDAEQVRVLLENGFVKSQQPAPDDKAYITTIKFDDGKDEAAQRRNLKWDTVKSQKVTKKVTGLNHPFIQLHAISRSSQRDRVNYSMILSIRAKNDMGLYQRTLLDYPQLIPMTERVISGRV